MNIAALALASLALVGSPPEIINGSFEQPWEGDGFYTSIPGWTLTVGSHFEMWHTWKGFLPAHGRQNLELDAFEPISFYQDIPTTPGAFYFVRFAFSPRPGTIDNRVRVAWNGVPIASVSANGQGLTQTHWTYQERAVMASGPVSRLSFTCIDTPDSFGSLLDDVSMRLNPCPGDVNGDFAVNFADLNIILSTYGARLGDLLYIPQADLNGDGVIDFADLNIVLSFFGVAC